MQVTGEGDVGTTVTDEPVTDAKEKRNVLEKFVIYILESIKRLFGK